MHLNIHYKTTKVSTYFQLKYATPFELSANVVYKFTYHYDTALSYIGYTARHLVTRVREHLNSNATAKSANKDHVYSCPKCNKKLFSVYHFMVL